MKPNMKIFLLLFVIFQVQGMGTALTEESGKINTHGYLSQGFLLSARNNFILDSKKGTFHFNELGLNFTTQLTDRIHIGIQFSARDFGDKGNDKVVIDWAFADYNWRNWLGLRLGKIKIQYGFYNKTRDIDMLRTFILLPQSIYPEIYRDTATSMKGIGLYGVFSPFSMGNVSYQAAIGATDVDLEGSTVDLFETTGDINITNCNVSRLFNGNLSWETPLKGLRIGLSLLNIKLKCLGTLTKDIIFPLNFPPYMITMARKGDIFNVEFSKYRINVFSVEYTRNNFVLAAEYMNMQQKMNVDVIDRYQNLRLWDTESYYISATYRFSEQFELGINYSAYTTDLNGTPDAPLVLPYLDYQNDLCAAVRFDLNPHWTFKVEGHLIEGAALCFPKYNLNDAGIPVFARNWALFGTKMTYTF